MRAKGLRKLLIFITLLAWLLSGWPRISSNPPIPPRLREARAITNTKTFSFTTTAEGFIGTSGGKSVLSYDSGTGNPAGSLKTDSAGRNNSDISDWTWSGTWEDLGVPTGATVTQVRINSGYTKVTAWNVVNSVTIGAYKLRDSLDADQATLWSGRSPTGIDADWVPISQQADQTVPPAIQASNSSVKLYLERTIDLGNDAATQATLYEDELSFVITYSNPVSITMSTDGVVAFDTVALEATVDTVSSGVETVSIDSGPADLDVRSTAFTEGANTWTLNTTNDSNQVKWEFSENSTDWAIFEAADTPYVLDTNVAEGQTRDLYLRLTMPTFTDSYDQYSSTVTIVASAP